MSIAVNLNERGLSMKKYMTLVAAIVMFSFTFASVALAQGGMRWKGGGGWGAGASYSRMYNPQTVQTITGEVVSDNKIRLPLVCLTVSIYC